ncbi:50S ribosomal protein L13 [Candidatus Wolfebacteria bacterium]|nr:50S ribosomal protein L13 [Candidatus Wolfebacteria bacterium]
MDYTIDAKNKNLGRLASEIAVILQGKKNPNYEPRLEGEDKVIVKNINGMTVSGKKETDKIYYRHTGYMGHLKEERMEEVIAKKGKREVLRRAVMRMLPKNRLQIKRIKKLIIEE